MTEANKLELQTALWMATQTGDRGYWGEKTGYKKPPPTKQVRNKRKAQRAARKRNRK